MIWWVSFLVFMNCFLEFYGMAIIAIFNFKFQTFVQKIISSF